MPKKGAKKKNPAVDAAEPPKKIPKVKNVEKKSPYMKMLDCQSVLFPCDYCNRVFPTKAGAARHMGVCAGKEKVIKEEQAGFSSEDEVDDEVEAVEIEFHEDNNNQGNQNVGEVDDVFLEEAESSDSTDSTQGEQTTIHITSDYPNTIEISGLDLNEIDLTNESNEDGQPIIITQYVSMPNSNENVEFQTLETVENSEYIQNENEPQYAELQPVSLSHVEEYVILPADQEITIDIEQDYEDHVENAPENNTENRDPLKTEEPSKKSYSSIYEYMKRQESNKPRDIYDFIDDDDPNDEAKLAREKLERTCEICDCEFGDPIELLAHRREKHKRQKITMSLKEIEEFFDYPHRDLCPICKRSIKTRGYKSVFIKHLLVHTEGTSLTSFECSVCNQKFRRRDHMKSHKRRHIV